MGMEAEFEEASSVARSGIFDFCVVKSAFSSAIEGAGSEMVRGGASSEAAGVATRESVGADFLVCRSVTGLNGMGLVFHWPRSADVRKKVVRLEA